MLQKHISKALAAATLLLCGSVCPAAAPTTVYAGGAHIYQSTDGGATWTIIGSGFGSVWSLAVDPADPATIYAGSDHGVFKSIDGGAHWNGINNGITPNFGAVTALLIDPQNPATIYAGTGVFGKGVFKSTNGGAAWTAINSGLTTNGSLDVRALAMDPSDPNTLYLTGVTGLSSAKSTNGGGTWTLIPAIAFGFAIAIDPTHTSTVYFAGPFGISKTDDSGATFSQINSGLTNTFVMSLAIGPTATRLLAGTGGNPNTPTGIVFQTTNGGALWSATSPALATYLNALAVDPAISSTIYAGGSPGIFRSPDAGATWPQVLAASEIRALAMQPPIQPITVEAALQDLTGDVLTLAGAPLNSGEVNSLQKKLQHALDALEKGKAKQGCNMLGAFVDEVNTLVQSGELPASEGAALAARAQTVMQAVPCQ